MTKRSTQPARAAQGDRVLTDPRAIRALAHPARLAVLEELSDGQEMTATECGAAVGITASAMSYHLRALAKWGFVERAESRDGRERPWRATATGWRIESMTNQLQATAASAVTSTMFQRVSADLARWFEHEPDQPAEWTEVAQVSSRSAGSPPKRRPSCPAASRRSSTRPASAPPPTARAAPGGSGRSASSSPSNIES